MLFRQYYLACLSHASYLIGDPSTGRAIVVDPQRDVAQYLTDAGEHGVRIERVIETHLHADFVSGHLELATATGAVVSYGAAAAGRLGFPAELLSDGQRLVLGEVVLEVRATPGHTPESISVVVYERPDDEVPYGVLTGDTLFIGDVGRPDLLASVGVSADDLAADLYRSLHDRLLTLPDATRVFPAHGAGSACGKQLSTETVSTIGEQRSHNYALAPMTEAEFVAVVTQGQVAAPPYFSFSAQRNREARDLLDEHVHTPLLDVAEVLACQRDGALLLDTRSAAEFARGHLAGSINVGLEGRFAEYAGDVVAPDSDVILIGEPGASDEARVRLARIGFDRVVGALADIPSAFLARADHVAAAARIDAATLAHRQVELPAIQIVDVRNDVEAALGAIPGATLIPLARLVARLGELDPETPTVVYCAGGYRSSIAASTLRARGFVDVSDLIGGYAAWSGARLPTVPPS